MLSLCKHEALVVRSKRRCEEENEWDSQMLVHVETRVHARQIHKRRAPGGERVRERDIALHGGVEPEGVRELDGQRGKGRVGLPDPTRRPAGEGATNSVLVDARRRDERKLTRRAQVL